MANDSAPLNGQLKERNWRGVHRSYFNDLDVEGSTSNEQDHEVSFTPQKRNLTLSLSRIGLNCGSGSVVIFTVPPNSSLIRATSSSTRRRSFPMTLIESPRDEMLEGLPTKLSRMADKCGEVAGLTVERAMGIQRRPPPSQPTPNFTSWRFGNLEKSKDW